VRNMATFEGTMPRDGLFDVTFEALGPDCGLSLAGGMRVNRSRAAWESDGMAVMMVITPAAERSLVIKCTSAHGKMGLGSAGFDLPSASFVGGFQQVQVGVNKRPTHPTRATQVVLDR